MRSNGPRTCWSRVRSSTTNLTSTPALRALALALSIAEGAKSRAVTSKPWEAGKIGLLPPPQPRSTARPGLRVPSSTSLTSSLRASPTHGGVPNLYQRLYMALMADLSRLGPHDVGHAKARRTQANDSLTTSMALNRMYRAVPDRVLDDRKPG